MLTLTITPNANLHANDNADDNANDDDDDDDDRTFISPVYLKCSEGRRLLASFFGLHPTLVAEIHAVMKAQMPGAKKAVLAAYGEVQYGFRMTRAGRDNMQFLRWISEMDCSGTFMLTIDLPVL